MKTTYEDFRREDLITADYICAIYNGERKLIWKRPQDELLKRFESGACQLVVKTIPCPTEEHLRQLVAIVDELKNGD